jgi:hypothetical protein
MDFFRDIIVNWISGVNSLLGGLDPQAAGAAIGGAAAQAGHFLALFISNGVWPAVLVAWGVWLTVWLATGLTAIISRRGKSA